ncbi:TBC1 domain family member 22B [Labeo rohita]|uniref:TBC1 domain family member 22B n=1 Tax=Labeo rohita TaxID=84645 RepID=A0ABQ8MRB6_LABRO|nr:TBC1 domain family member 22B [Labeo rohita]
MSYARQAVICEPCLLSVCEKAARRRSVIVVLCPSKTVHRHMQQYEVEYLQFAFRWMNNLLMRELPLRCTIRLWDTYQVKENLKSL